MMFFLIALIIGAFGAAIVFLCKGVEVKAKTIAFVVLLVIYTLLGWWIFYGGLFSFAWPLWGGYGAILFVWWCISCIVAGVMNYDDCNGPDWNHCYWFVIGAIVLYCIIGISGCSALRDDEYAKLIGPIEDKTTQHWSQDIQQVDPAHVRLVPKELAISLARTALGQDGSAVGSQFPISEEYVTLQKIKGDYFYLVPLDFEGWTVWTDTNKDGVPGYIKVFATDPYAKPLLVMGKKMKYTPGAWFGDNLSRRLYWKYSDKILTDFSLEEDDEDHVFWVITAYLPTISYWGPVIDGVIIFDPETGEDEYVKMKEIDNNPKYSWIDRVVPAEIVQEYIDEWGNLKGGWPNSWWHKKNLLEPETPTLNYAANGRCIWVTPVTSKNEKDEAMTGVMYTDARTGKPIYYATSGGATEAAIIDAVNSQLQYKKWEASSQMVYENVGGIMAALVPVLGQKGNYQSLAIVETRNKRIAIGLTPAEALVEFQRIMAAGGQIAVENKKNIKEFQGKIIRIGWDISNAGGAKQYYIFFNNFKQSFAVSSGSLQSELALSMIGDEVFVRYIDSNQTSLPTLYFRNITLDLFSSDGQKAVSDQMDNRQKSNKKASDTKDFRERIKNMPDEEIQKMMEKEK